MVFNPLTSFLPRFVAFCGLSSALFSAPVITDPSWILEETASTPSVWSLATNPSNNGVYYLRRTTSGGVFRLNSDGSSQLLANFNQPAGLTVDPENGNLFVSLDFPGQVNRVSSDGLSNTLWLSGFASGDDDPAGLYYIPESYTGGLFPVGSFLLTDRGFNGNESVWSFSGDTSQNETLLYSQNTGDSFFDILTTKDKVIVVDAAVGLRELTAPAPFTLGPALTSESLIGINAAVWDSQRDVIYAAINNSNLTAARLVKIDLNTDTVTEIATGFSQLRWGSIAINNSTRKLYAGDFTAGELYRFSIPNSSTFSDDSFAYSANAGWINFKTPDQGVVVTESYLSGFAYSANTGWIKFGNQTPDNGYQFTNDNNDHGVNHDDAGNLSGYAWSANTGWLSFDWASSTDPNRPRIDLTTGNFSGFTWNANIGWVNLETGLLKTDVILCIDSDQDGISDSWENLNFGNLTTAGINTDFDKDGQSDAYEALTLTDPKNAQNFFSAVNNIPTFDSPVLGESEITLAFLSSPSRLYEIFYSNDLNQTDPWTSSSLGQFLGDPTFTTKTINFPSNDNKFFTIQVSKPLSNQ